MKGIMFRGKTKEGGWAYGCGYQQPTYRQFYGILVCVTFPDILVRQENLDKARTGLTMVLPETVGQFTTYYDRDGGQIFDSDVLYVSALRTQFTARVKMNASGVFLVPYPEEDYHSYYRFKPSWGDGCKVMGNTHDGMPERETTYKS